MTATTPTDGIEATLRGELSARAVGLAAGEPPLPRIVTAVRKDRLRRRTHAGTGFVLAAALIAAMTPAIIGATRGAGAASAAARSGGPAELLSMAPRGNLVRDTDFMRAVNTRLPGAKVLYAEDDGTHTIVIDAVDTTSSRTEFRTLIGRHGATPSELATATGGVGLDGDAQTYAFVGDITDSAGPVPLVVLGTKSLTDVQYATGIKLVERQGKLVPERTGVKRIRAADGVAAAEFAHPASLDSSSDFGLYFGVRAKIGKQYVSTSPAVRVLPETSAGNIEDADYDPVRAAVVARGKAAGLSLALKGPDGDALADNVSLVLSDVANLSRLTPGQVQVRIDWVGRETSKWDAALVDFTAPGLPAIQAFVRGLAPGASHSDSPSLAQSFVRPARPLIEGQFPTTAAAFGGTAEFSTIGGGLFERW